MTRFAARAAAGGTAALLLALAVRAASASVESHRLFLRGALEEREGNPQAALLAYREAARLDPQSAYLQERLGEAALGAGQADLAVEAARRAVLLDTTTVSGHILLGRSLLARGEALPAQAAFEQALRIDPSDVEALGWATSQKALSDSKGALALFESFLKANPQAGRVREQMAILQGRQGDEEQAEASWRAVLERDPANGEARLALAGIYDARGDAEAALDEYEAYLELEPDRAAVLGRVGQLHFAAGRIEEAREAFGRAVSLSPEDEGLNFWCALAAQEAGDWAEAAKHMERVARKNADPGVLLRLSVYYSRQDRHKDSLRVLKRLHKSDPKNADFMFYLALACEDAERPRSAIRWLEKARAAEPDRAELHFHLGINWDRRGRFERALPFLRRAVELDPGNHLALNYLGYSLADRNRDLEEALGLIERAVALEPGNPAYRDSLGWAYFRLGRLAEAETALGSAVHPAEDAVVWSHYGDVLNALGRRPEAVRAWQEGLLLEPNDEELLAKLGEEGKPSAVTPLSAARTLLKRVEGNYRQLRSLSGLAAVSIRNGAGDLSGNAFFYYERPNRFRIEILGPLFAPRAVLTARGGEVRWSPGGEAPVDAGPWLETLARVLSGEIFKAFDDPSVTVRMEETVLVYEGGPGEIRIDGRSKALVQALVRQGGGARVALSGTQEEEGLRVPLVLEGGSLDGQVSFKIRFSRLAVNRGLRPELFEPR